MPCLVHPNVSAESGNLHRCTRTLARLVPLVSAESANLLYVDPRRQPPCLLEGWRSRCAAAEAAGGIGREDPLPPCGSIEVGEEQKAPRFRMYPRSTVKLMQRLRFASRT